MSWVVGVEQFANDSSVLVSGNAPEFLSPENLPEHSLCNALGIELPNYKPAFVLNHHEIQVDDRENKVSLGLVAIYTPGHTPDELALWDAEQKILYVGDTVYEWAPIIFPNEGSITTWWDTMNRLLDLVRANESATICCGHVTAGRPAEPVLAGALDFMSRVLTGVEKEEKRMIKRGEIHVMYSRQGGRFSLICPERLIDEARRASLSWDEVAVSAVQKHH